MKTLLCLAVACVGLAGFASTSAQAQDPAATTTTTSTTTMHHHHHHHHMHRHHMHHHMHHHMDSAVTPQKPAAENPTAAPQ